MIIEIEVPDVVYNAIEKLAGEAELDFRDVAFCALYQGLEEEFSEEDADAIAEYIEDKHPKLAGLLKDEI